MDFVGQCLCEHNTVGDNCEKCAPGYYGYALRGQADDCTKCPCPDGGECVEITGTGEVACLNCREGYTGKDVKAIVVFTPISPSFLWRVSHNFRETVLKFAFFANFHTPNKSLYQKHRF